MKFFISFCIKKIKIHNYIFLPPNNEIILKKAVKKQPIVTAIDSNSIYFKIYKKGIFDKCNTNINHAVLIIGYGIENNIKYWLVKNSWGKRWGINGYIKIKRTDSNNTRGICGIAISPSYPVLY